MARVNPGEFIRQVRQEANKVTWPNRTETIQSTIMVLIMVAIVAIFFFVVDMGLSWLVRAVLSIRI